MYWSVVPVAGACPWFMAMLLSVREIAMIFRQDSYSCLQARLIWLA